MIKFIGVLRNACFLIKELIGSRIREQISNSWYTKISPYI